MCLEHILKDPTNYVPNYWVTNHVSETVSELNIFLTAVLVET